MAVSKEVFPTLHTMPAEIASIAPVVLDLAQRLFAADAYAIWRRRSLDSEEWVAISDAGLPENYPRTISGSIPISTPTVLVFEDACEAPELKERMAAYREAGIRSILTVPICVRGECTVTLSFYYRRPRRFNPEEIRTATALANLAASAITTAELHEEQQRLRQAAELAEKRSRFLAEASKVLASSLDYETTLKHIADLVVPELADWCTIDLVQPDGPPLQVAVAHKDPARLAWAREVQPKLPFHADAPTGLARVLRTGKPELYPYISDELLVETIADPEQLDIVRQIGITSLVVVPLIAREQILGAITLISAESGVRYDERTVALAEDLARRAATAIDNARLFHDSRAAAAALVRSEARFQQLMHAGVIGIQFSNRDGVILDANEAFLRLTGYDREDLAARRICWSTLTSGAYSREPIGPSEAGRILPVELELVRKDGSRFPALVGAARSEDTPEESPAVVLDLTALKRAEEAVRHLTEHARCLFWHAYVDAPAAPGEPYRWDIRMFDEAAADRFIPLDRRPGESYMGAFYRNKPREDRLLGEQIAREAFESNAPGYELDFRCRGRDGKLHWLHEQTHLERLGPDRWRAVGVCTEITERKELEEAALRLAAIVESSQDAIIGQSLDGVITSWNRGAERMYGYSAEEAVGQPITMLTPPDVVNELPQIMERLARGEMIEHYETVRMRKDGSLLDVSLSISPIVDQTGRVVGAAKIARDITDKKALEAELRRRVEELAAADRRKDEFLAMLAHELRNPLGAISNALHVLQQSHATEPMRHRAVKVLQRQVLHQSRMVDDLLDVSRLTRGLMVIRQEPVDLNRLVRDTAEDYRATLEAEGLTLELDLACADLWVHGDTVRLVQVLGNLLTNAAKFTARGGRVTVATTADEAGNARVTVRDTGEGIVPKLLPVVFDSFVQGERSLARSRGGLGLGLAIVRGLVELHGGSVKAESPGPGAGASFTFALPRIPGRNRGVASDEHVDAAERSLRVLLVEDNRDAAESLRDVLELHGYEVELAFTGTMALDTAHRWKPDVVLCDIGLPGMNGYDVARALRSSPDLPLRRLIAITGYGEEEHRRRVRDAGFDEHLLKPIDPERLHQLLQSC